MLYDFDLVPYQLQISAFMRANPFAAAWVPMGYGKTISELTALKDLYEANEAKHTLVTGPLRVMDVVWEDEIAKWAHVNNFTISKILGTPTERWNALRKPADLHLINVDNLSWLHAQFIEGKKQFRRFPWDTIVPDESQLFKSQSSNRHKVMRDFRRLVKRMHQLTGTPSPEGYQDVWGQIRLLDHGKRLGANETAFKNRWFNRIQREEHYVDWEIKPGAEEEIQDKVRDIVIAIKDEKPPVPVNFIKVRLDPKDLAAYKKFEREKLIELKGQKITAVNAGAVAGKLLQFANGAVYYDDRGNFTEIHDAKLDRLCEIADSAAAPMLTAYAFKHDLARMQRALARTRKRIGVIKTARSIREWNDGRYDVGLIHPGSAGHGLNLQHSHADLIIWFGLTCRREHWDQLNARLIGGHRRIEDVSIGVLMAEGTRDFHVYHEILEPKGVSQSGLMRALAINA